MIGGIIYLIGCILAAIITINEFLHHEQKSETIHEYDENINQDHQYGLVAVAILLSWVFVICWYIGYIKNKQ